MINFCTLFDINFINQGLVMHESLLKHCKDFHLYIFAFCDKSYALLKELDLKNTTIIPLKEFEDEELLKIKPTRTRGEYCWTCSSSTILYCLEKYNLPSCTYLDADLYFYSDPKVLLDEMGEKSVLITEHNYTKEYDQSEKSGRFCVQFITFKNNEKGIEVLNWWRNACLEWCFARCEDGKFGDQKYLDTWPAKFDCVHILQNLGGGVAPWNVQQYDFTIENDKIYLIEKSSQKKEKVVFFHEHSIKIKKNGYIDINHYDDYEISDFAKKIFYKDYVDELIKMSQHLHKKDSSIKVIKFCGFNFRKLRKWIITIRFSKKSKVIRLCGIYFLRKEG